MTTKYFFLHAEDTGETDRVRIVIENEHRNICHVVEFDESKYTIPMVMMDVMEELGEYNIYTVVKDFRSSETYEADCLGVCELLEIQLSHRRGHNGLFKPKNNS